ncbi:MAG: protease HtpX [Oligoflexales bacterium]
MFRFIRPLFYMLLVNILIMVMINIILGALGVSPSMGGYGRPVQYESLLIFCFVWGIAGAFISLQMSRWLAKRMHGLEMVDENHRYSALCRRVHDLATRAGLPAMPEVAVYESPEVNAFATGPSRSRSLVAVSTGLLRQMDAKEVDGVLAHEVSHIANGDMVVMTLVQGVVNAFVMFFARVATLFLDQMLRGDDREEGGGLGYFGSIMVNQLLHVVFGLLSYPLVAWVSRQREYRADAGGASLAGPGSMVAALERLKQSYPSLESREASTQVMNISGRLSSWSELMSTHPSLDDRIARLRRQL